MTEEWREVPGHPGYYASSEGFIRGPRGRLVGSSSRDGYIRIGISGPPRRCLSRASMVAAAFIGPRPLGFDIDHIDEARSNDRPENLRYLTHAENMARIAVEKLRTNARLLTEADALAIRQSSGRLVDLAAQYGVSACHISRIRNGLAWRRASQTEGRGRPQSKPIQGHPR